MGLRDDQADDLLESISVIFESWYRLNQVDAFVKEVNGKLAYIHVHDKVAYLVAYKHFEITAIMSLSKVHLKTYSGCYAKTKHFFDAF
jgi:hypothetical protein